VTVLWEATVLMVFAVNTTDACYAKYPVLLTQEIWLKVKTSATLTCWSLKH